MKKNNQKKKILWMFVKDKWKGTKMKFNKQDYIQLGIGIVLAIIVGSVSAILYAKYVWGLL